MSTLGTLKAQIADDLARDDLESQIAAEIPNAIDFYQEKRFWFNETESATFVTVAAQTEYDVDDDADIPLFIDIDEVEITDSSGSLWQLAPVSAGRMKYLLSLSSSGRPTHYSYFASKFHFYPAPDTVYTITPIGHITKAEPANDDVEDDNVWMNEAKELIRCRAKAYISTHVTMDLEMAQAMSSAEQDAYAHLRRKTNKRQASTSKMIEATDF